MSKHSLNAPPPPELEVLIGFEPKSDIGKSAGLHHSGLGSTRQISSHPVSSSAHVSKHFPLLVKMIFNQLKQKYDNLIILKTI